VTSRAEPAVVESQKAVGPRWAGRRVPAWSGGSLEQERLRHCCAAFQGTVAGETGLADPACKPVTKTATRIPGNGLTGGRLHQRCCTKHVQARDSTGADRRPRCFSEAAASSTACNLGQRMDRAGSSASRTRSRELAGQERKRIGPGATTWSTTRPGERPVKIASAA